MNGMEGPAVGRSARPHVMTASHCSGESGLQEKGVVPFHGCPLNPGQLKVARLKHELDRVTEERDILKKAVTYFARESR